MEVSGWSRVRAGEQEEMRAQEKLLTIKTWAFALGGLGSPRGL